MSKRTGMAGAVLLALLLAGPSGTALSGTPPSAGPGPRLDGQWLTDLPVALELAKKESKPILLVLR